MTNNELEEQPSDDEVEAIQEYIRIKKKKALELIHLKTTEKLT